jgi:hypothetical protein
MALYISIDDQKVRFKRSDIEVGGTFWKVEDENAKYVFETAYRAKQEDAKYSRIYDKLKAGGQKSFGIYRNNAWADALIFAATGVTQALNTELTQYEKDVKEAYDRNNAGEGEEFFLLYA